MQVEIYPKKHQFEEQKQCVPNEAEKKLDQSIKNIIEREEFLKYNIEKKYVSTNGGNYIGELYEIDVKGKTREGDKELNIFVKTIQQDENEMKLFSVAGVYQTEMFTYKELSKIFMQLQDEANVPSAERYKMVKFYDESNVQAIIMENVTKKGYTTNNRLDIASLKFAQMAVKELAKFHALSFVLKEKRPGYFEKNIRTMKSPFNFGEDMQGFVQNMVNMVMPHVTEDHKDRYENFCTGLFERYKNCFENETHMRCLCHGDYRSNNIMTKIINGEITDVIPVDYQIVHFGCPVIDFSYFIFTCTDRKFRKAHLSHLKDLYYNTLIKFLNYFDIDVNVVYSRKEFDMDYEAKIYYGLVSSILIMPIILASEDDVPDVINNKMSTISFNVDDKFKDRLRDVLDDYIEWDLI